MNTKVEYARFIKEHSETIKKVTWEYKTILGPIEYEHFENEMGKIRSLSGFSLGQSSELVQDQIFWTRIEKLPIGTFSQEQENQLAKIIQQIHNETETL